MNRSSTVITYVNAAHFIDHYVMLIFAAAIIVLSPVFQMGYGDLLPYAAPSFITFGAGSLVTGWLGDRWSRRHMMVIFFVGIGFASIAVGFVQTPLQLALALFAVGLFAAIYHPVGTAMLVSYAERLGRDMGINGLWGNLGVASSAVVTGAICEFLSWRWAFILPGIISCAIGIAFFFQVHHEVRSSSKKSAPTPTVSKRVMWQVVVALFVTIIGSSTTFNAVTVALPKLFHERLTVFSENPAMIGLIAAGVYVCGAMAQYIIGHLIDKYSLKAVFLPLSFLLTPMLWFAAYAFDLPLILASIGIIVGIFGLVTVNDAMVGKYTAEEWRSRAYSVRYFVGFTAAGVAVSTVSWLHELGGFILVMQSFSAICILVIIGALIFPHDVKDQGTSITT